MLASSHQGGDNDNLVDNDEIFQDNENSFDNGYSVDDDNPVDDDDVELGWLFGWLVDCVFVSICMCMCCR